MPITANRPTQNIERYNRIVEIYSRRYEVYQARLLHFPRCGTPSVIQVDHYRGRNQHWRRQQQLATGHDISRYVARHRAGQISMDQLGYNVMHAISSFGEHMQDNVLEALDLESIIRRCSECNTLVIHDAMFGSMCEECYDEAYSEDDDYGSDYDEYTDDSGIASYHRHRLRYSLSYFVEPSKATPFDPGLGMEIELYAEHVGSVANGFDGWIVERDASIDNGHGVEVVSPPYLLREWKEQRLPWFIAGARDCGASAYNAPGGVYGIHITVARKHLSPLQEARIGFFLGAEANADFVRVIAQRQQIYSGDGIGSLSGCLEVGGVDKLGGFSPPTYRYVGTNFRRIKKLAGRGKFWPAHFKDALLEFRIFQSSIKTETMLKNLEFVHALINWTNPKRATGTAWHHQAFVDWLLQYEAKTYPMLVAYLKRPDYQVRNGRGRISNTWVR